MIKRSDLFSIPFYKKSAFTGSDQGMRYRIERIDREEAAPLLKATYWPGPYAFAATPEEQKKSDTFPFTDEGIGLACDWLNERYTEESESFRKVHVK
ncbi:MAG: hypothetical protein IJ567_04555 [Lachnospiraceae bacterium]|nr:hypothetical protein [Lachnospiraceae bacterium]